MAGVSLDEAPITDINITPLVDVCLVLVIIFMVTAPLFSDPAIKVRLPSARTHEGEETDKVTLTLAKDGRTALDQETFADVRDLEARLKAKLAASGSKLVILRADADAEYGPLTDLMSRAKDAGAQSLTIATERRK